MSTVASEGLLNAPLRRWFVFLGVFTRLIFRHNEQRHLNWEVNLPGSLAGRESVGSCSGLSGQEAGGRVVSHLHEQLLALSTACAEGDPIGTHLPVGCTTSLWLTRVKEGGIISLSLENVLLCLC